MAAVSLGGTKQVAQHVLSELASFSRTLFQNWNSLSLPPLSLSLPPLPTNLTNIQHHRTTLLYVECLYIYISLYHEPHPSSHLRCFNSSISRQMDAEQESQQLECCCLNGDDCEKHQMTPDKRLEIMEEAVVKIRKIMDGDVKLSFTSDEYINYYTCAFSLSSLNAYGSRASQLFQKFMGALEGSLVLVVLPALEGKEHVQLLTKLLEMWSKYKAMAHWLSRFFAPLENYSMVTTGSSLINAPINLICDLVIDVLWSKIQTAIIYLINLERVEKFADRSLLKTVIDFLVEIGTKGRRRYFQNLEQGIRTDTMARYSRLASKWQHYCSFYGYIRKVEWFMTEEERRMRCCLPETTVEMLLEAVRTELLDFIAKNLVELISRGQ